MRISPLKTSEAAAQWQALTKKENHDFYNMAHEPITRRESQDARALLVQWAYKVVDRYSLDRCLVSFAFHYYDSFMSIYSDLDDFTCRQLLAITCIYIAAKLHGNRRKNPLSITRLVRISKGYFEAQQIEEMEKRLINVLAWYLNPPIPILIIQSVNDLLSTTPGKDCAVYDVAVYLIELSVCDHFFVTKRPSCIAAAAIQVAVEFSGCNIDVLLLPLSTGSTKMTTECESRMRKLYKARFPNPDTEETSRCSDISPTDVMIDSKHSL